MEEDSHDKEKGRLEIFTVFVHNPKGNMLAKLQSRLVENYFCFREENEDKVNFI